MLDDNKYMTRKEKNNKKKIEYGQSVIVQTREKEEPQFRIS